MKTKEEILDFLIQDITKVWKEIEEDLKEKSGSFCEVINDIKNPYSGQLAEDILKVIHSLEPNELRDFLAKDYLIVKNFKLQKLINDDPSIIAKIKSLGKTGG